MNVALSGFSDSTLVDRAKLAARSERHSTSVLVAYLAEIDSRRIYAAAGYSSMRAWCVSELGLCEQDAARRIGAARAARRFPVILESLADGRLHLTAVNLLTPWLTESNAAELLVAAEHKTRAEIEELLARRFPRPDTPTSITPVPAPSPMPAALLATAPVEDFRQLLSPAIAVAGNDALTTPASPPLMSVPPSRTGRVTPLSAERLEFKTTISRETNEKLRRAQELLGHGVAPGDMAAVLDRALDALIERSSITSGRTPVMAGRRRRTCDSAAGRTTSTRPRKHSAPGSCRTSASRRDWHELRGDHVG